MSAYTDNELEDKEKAYVCLRRLYGDDFYKIPSQDYEEAISTVISQCEMWTDYIMVAPTSTSYSYAAPQEKMVAEPITEYREK